MSLKVAINGFGRIGRCVLRAALQQNAPFEVVAVNDLASSETLAHLFKYDSITGIFPGKVAVDGDSIKIDDHKVKVLSEKIDSLPWNDLGVDIVIEATGIFRDRTSATTHIDRGAKKVIITAPAKGEDITMAMGVNENKFDPDNHHIISNASCTTNCLAPVAKVLNENFGIIDGLMTTIHSYTNDQKILDQPHKDLRRARAAAVSMIPTTTGAAKAVGLVLPELQGKLNGLAVRVPTPNVSLVDLVVRLNKKVSKSQVNESMKKAAEGPLKGILLYMEEELVSKDFEGNPHSSIFDAPSTYIIGGENVNEGDMVKVLSWYDNEWGYSSRIVDCTTFVAKKAGWI